MKDNVSRDEARAAVIAVIDHVGNRDWRGYNISVGTWQPMDAQNTNSSCAYSVNVESWDGVYGRSWCVGDNEQTDALEVFDELEWVITLTKPRLSTEAS